MASLAEIIEAAEDTQEPGLISSSLPQPGGVDPLGLRQINFDLMDQVFPGINNIARHIRPFSVVTWAWRRAATIADQHGQTLVPVSVLRDFVDRIEVVFAWSQFLRDPECVLPGRDVLAPLLHRAEYEFGGDEWERRKTARAYSTALSAPINYGPALKTFGWLQADPSGALVATAAVQEALAAMDEAMGPYLDHPVFSSFGEVGVSGTDVGKWAEAWRLDRPTKSEKLAMAETMAGDLAPRCRREGVALVVAVSKHLGGAPSDQSLRRAMCGPPNDFRAPPALEQAAKAWRVTQNRQAFRLALEALFYWICLRLENGAASTGALVREFLAEAGEAETAGRWFEAVRTDELGPADWIERLDRCLYDDDHWAELPATIRAVLAACIAEAPDKAGTERADRLPLARAAQESAGWRDHPVAEFLTHVLDSWVFGQHVYWSVGRGLADARARGRSILRLKVALEDEGWTMTPGASVSAPRATADRLGTMISLMREADLLPDERAD